MITFASDVLVQQTRLVEADAYTAEGLSLDPLLDLSWVLRSRYYIAAGDIPAARAAADEALRIQALYPDDKVDLALVQQLLDDLASVAR